MSGENADFELPGATGGAISKRGVSSTVVVDLPIFKGGNPLLSDVYLSKESLYLNGGKRQNARLSLAILSDLYTDGNGNYYRGYEVRKWIGREPELWSLGRSNIAGATYTAVGAGRINDSRDSNTSAVDIVDLDFITPITEPDLHKIKAGIDEAKTDFDKVGNIYVRKGN